MLRSKDVNIDHIVSTTTAPMGLGWAICGVYQPMNNQTKQVNAPFMIHCQSAVPTGWIIPKIRATSPVSTEDINWTSSSHRNSNKELFNQRLTLTFILLDTSEFQFIELFVLIITRKGLIKELTQQQKLPCIFTV